MISLAGITRVYEVGGRPVHALRGIDLELPGGDYLAIMGPSGSGKSTLLNILGCLDWPSAGSYRLDGREVSGLDDQELSLVRRHKNGFVFQVFHLVPRLTALENVALPLLFAGVSPRERGERARSAKDLQPRASFDRYLTGYFTPNFAPAFHKRGYLISTQYKL